MQKCKSFGLITVALTLILLSAPVYAAQAPKIVVDRWEIPWMGSWTGSVAGLGALADHFQKAAVAEINANGGIAGKPLVMIDCDTAIDPDRVVSCMKKATEKSLIILGPFESLAAKIGCPIAAKAGVMSLPVTTPVETLSGVRPWVVTLSPPLSKRNNFFDNAWIDRNPDIKKVVMLGYDSMAVYKIIGDLQEGSLKKRGVSILDRIDVQVGVVDISSVVIRTLRSKPDGILLRLFPQDVIRIVTELEKRGLKNKEKIQILVTADTPATYSMAAEAGNILDGCYIGVTDSTPTTPAQLKLLEVFRKLKGQEKATTLMWADLYYIATYLIKDAIEKTGVTGDPAKLTEERVKIRNYINTVKDFDPRIMDPLTVQPDGSFNLNMYLAQIRNSKPVIVKTMK